MLSTQPASILGIDAGVLSVNKPADLCIYDPSHNWQLDAETMLSRGKNTPFEGWDFEGKVRYTLIDGTVIHSDR